MQKRFERGKCGSSSSSKFKEKPSAFSADRSGKDVECYQCGKKGHYKRDCRSKPKDSKDEKKRSGGSEAKSGHFAFSVNNEFSDTVWIKDSGASHHYTNDRTIMTKFKDANDFLHVADGGTVEIRGVGSILFNVTTSNGDMNTLELREVYYAPGLKVNLLSTTEFDKHGIEEISRDGVSRFMKGGNEIVCAKMEGNRWIMQMTPDKQEANSVVSADDWHKRMCHLSHENLAKLEKMVDGFRYKKPTEITCDACNKGKITRRPFKSSTNPRSKPNKFITP